MIRSKYISAVVALCVCLALLFSFYMMVAASTATPNTTEYEKRLFNGETVDIAIEVDPDDWQSLLDNAQAKEYISADIIINGELFSTVGIRTKGNSSLTQTGGNERYSLQLNPNKYVSGQSFYGLDSMCLNNLMGDATYMKDYLSYDIMEYLGVASPLRNYARVSVNGEDYGLFLLLERYDDSYLDRVYGSSSGELYNVKMQMGERSAFEAGEWEPQRPESTGEETGDTQTTLPGAEDAWGAGGGMMPSFGEDSGGMMSPFGEGDTQSLPPDSGTGEMLQMPSGQSGEMPQFDGNALPDTQQQTDTQEPSEDTGLSFGGMGGMQVMGGFSSGGGSLLYTDDDPASYGSIFNNAVSNNVSESDQQQVIKAIKNLNEGEDLEDYWDVDEVLRYLAAHTFVVNLDSYVSSMQQNYYLLEQDGVLSILPWDYNLAFGGYNSRDADAVVNFPIDTPVSGVNMEDRPLVSQLLAVDEYRERYHAYLQEIVEGYVESGLLQAEIDRLDAQISADVATDATAYYTHAEYETAVATLRELISLRAQSVAGQLDGSIPSTTEGQSENPDALIDASSIDLSAMGSMGGAAGMGGDRDLSGWGGDFSGIPGEGETGAAPDAQTMQDILGALQSGGTLTEAQKEALAALGLSESDLESITGGTEGIGGQGDDAQGFGQSGFQGMGQMPGEGGGLSFGSSGQGATSTTAPTTGDWILYGAVGLLLIAATLFAALYPKKKWTRID